MSGELYSPFVTSWEDHSHLEQIRANDFIVFKRRGRKSGPTRPTEMLTCQKVCDITAGFFLN